MSLGQAILSSDASSDRGVTVVVSVRDREPHRLRNLLRTIRAQTYPREHVQITVVDYDSNPQHTGVYQDICEQHDAILYRIDYRPIWSRSEALNVAIRLARTRYTMIADVDIIYAPNYIECAIASL